MSDEHLDKLRKIIVNIDESSKKSLAAKQKSDMHNFFAYLSEEQVARMELEKYVRKMLGM